MVLRVSLGAFLIGHAYEIYKNLSDVLAMMGQLGHSTAWPYVMIVTESLAGIALVVGAFLWIAGPAIVIAMALYVFGVIRPTLIVQGAPFLEGFIFAWAPYLMYAAAALALAFTGAGRYSLAALWMRRHHVKCRDCKMDHGMPGCEKCDAEHPMHADSAPAEKSAPEA